MVNVFRKKIKIIFAGAIFICLAFFLVHLNKANSAAPLKGLFGYWSMDNTDVSGQAYYDKSGFNKIGTGPSSLKITAGKLKQARNFIGNPNSITIISSPIPANGTISAWVRTRNTGAIGVFAINGPTPELRMNDGLIYCYSHQTSTPAVSTRIVNDGRWHHVACTWRGTTSLKAYIDSIPDGSSTPTTTPSGTGNMYIGNGGDLNNFWYVGDIDEVRLYNHDLSQAEISGIYSDTGAVLSYAPVAVNPIAWWTMDAKTIQGQTIFDQTQNHHDLTSFPIGSPTTTLGKFKEGISFDGGNGYASGTLSKLLPSFNNTSITFMAWVNSAFSGTRSVMVDSRTGGGNTQWSCRVDSSGVLTFLVTNDNDGSKTITSSGVNTNKWQHVACVWDINNPRNDIASIYINGSVKATFSSSTFATSGVTGRPRALGVAFNEGAIFTVQPDYFNGKMDDVRIYNQALTSSTILKIYNETQKAFISYPELIDYPLAYWTFDNTDTIGGTVRDRSGNNYNGNTSGTVVVPGKIKQAHNFDGGGSNIGLGLNTFTEGQMGTGTMATWFKINQSATQYFLSLEDGYTFGFNNSGTTLTCNAGGMVTNAPTATYADGRWHHYLCTWDGTHIFIFVDGVRVRSGTGTHITPLSSINDNSYIGRAAGGGIFFYGNLDDMRLYSYRMATSSIRKLYNSAKTLQIK